MSRRKSGGVFENLKYKVPTMALTAALALAGSTACSPIHSSVGIGTGSSDGTIEEQDIQNEQIRELGFNSMSDIENCIRIFNDLECKPINELSENRREEIHSQLAKIMENMVLTHFSTYFNASDIHDISISGDLIGNVASKKFKIGNVVVEYNGNTWESINGTISEELLEQLKFFLEFKANNDTNVSGLKEGIYFVLNHTNYEYGEKDGVLTSEAVRELNPDKAMNLICIFSLNSRHKTGENSLER